MSDSAASPSAAAQVLSPPLAASGRTRRRAVRGFHVGLALLLVGLVLAGFWPSYFGHLARGTSPDLPWVVHVHGVVFSGWMVLLVAQVVLAARGRIGLHRALGRFGIFWGALVWVFGTAVTFVAPALKVASGVWTRDQAASFLILPIGDMILFGGFFAAAVCYRHKPEIHKRLIVLATIALMFAPAGRLSGESLALFFVLWIAPLAAALIHDLWSRGRLHPVYAIGTAVLLVAFARVPAMESAWWMRVGRAIVDGMVPPA
jgi:hypothetical protein